MSGIGLDNRDCALYPTNTYPYLFKQEFFGSVLYHRSQITYCPCLCLFLRDFVCLYLNQKARQEFHLVRPEGQSAWFGGILAGTEAQPAGQEDGSFGD